MPARSSPGFASSLAATLLPWELAPPSWRYTSVSKNSSAIFTITCTSKTTFSSRAPSKWNLYWMQTDSWYLERRIYVVVGFNIALASVLVLAYSKWFLLFTGFVGAASVWFAATGFCIMANGFYWLGAEPRLAPEFRESCPVASPGQHAQA